MPVLLSLLAGLVPAEEVQADVQAEDREPGGLPPAARTKVCTNRYDGHMSMRDCRVSIVFITLMLHARGSSTLV